MAFKQIKTHKKIISSTGEELTPVATLQNEKGILAHIVSIEGCFACFIYSDAVEGYVLTPYITSELHKTLAKLPPIVEE